MAVSLLLKAEVSIRVGWCIWWRGQKATVYIVAKPKLDVENQSITLTDLKLDIDSRNELVAALGEVAEPWLLRAVNDRNTVALGPIEKELREKAAALVGALSSDGVDVEFGIDSIRLIPSRHRTKVSSSCCRCTRSRCSLDENNCTPCTVKVIT